MKSFEYGDQDISNKELFFIVASMMMGVSILSIPRKVASVTNGVDGIFSILMAGLFFGFFGWLTSKVVSKFPRKTFREYTSDLLGKPIGTLLTLLLGLSFLFTVSFETRSLASIARLYMFNETPLEVISLIFLLVVNYAVAGSRVALIRLNLMFFPIIMFIVLAVQFFNIGFIELENVKPILTTNFSDLITGSYFSSLAFVGYIVIFFYTALVKDTTYSPLATVLGMSVPFLIYLVIYFFAIGVFSVEVTRNIIYPTIEVAKEVEVPGEFFERFESIFFTIWIMTIFTTATLAFDCAINALQSIFKKTKRLTWVLMLSPIIYIIAMFPKSVFELELLGVWLGYSGILYGVGITSILFIVSKVRGIKSEA
ncbi:endospore germination permease [Cytobacillus suaedae]|nr:endospore germination permease [Cytobacillus suaedae]